jgi:hypothetical protein
VLTQGVGVGRAAFCACGQVAPLQLLGTVVQRRGTSNHKSAAISGVFAH